MALKPCPECGSQVSSRATSCPKCGCPVSKVKVQVVGSDKKANQQKNVSLRTVGVTMTLLAGFIGMLVFNPTACQVQPTQEQSAMVRMDNYLRASLRDYGSAKIDWTSLAISGGRISVRVNARNGFGAYTGYETITISN